MKARRKTREINRPTEDRAIRNIMREAQRRGFSHRDGDYLRFLATKKRGLVIPSRDAKVVTWEDTLVFLSAVEAL